MFTRTVSKSSLLLTLLLLGTRGRADTVALTTAKGAPTPTTSRLGINLDRPRDWGTEIPFADVFKTSRVWLSGKPGEKNGEGPAPELDENGWVKRIDADRYVETPFLNVRDDQFPAGNYTLLYEGEGKIILRSTGGPIKVVEDKPGRIIFTLTPINGFKTVRIMSTNPDNYVRNIRIYLPGVTEESYKQNPWNPVFLDRWKGFSTFRFMDWMATNGSDIKEWADRPRMTDANWSPKGVPLAMMIDLCNRTGINPWFCMPHEATDDYVRQFATEVKKELRPDLKAYVEYSNEIWNLGFPQTKYSEQKGIELKLADGTVFNQAARRYCAYRSVQIFKIWEDVFGGRDRFLRVMATQSVSANVSEEKLGFQDAYKQCDILATAPYFGPMVNIKNDRKPDMVADKVSTWTVDQLLDYVEQEELPRAIAAMQKQKAIADKYHLKLVAYEGGQHMVGIRLATQNEALTKLFYAANRHERMGQIYTKYLDAWRDAGGGTFCLFNSVARWSKTGSWGLLESNVDSTPKYEAVMRWNEANVLPAAQTTVARIP